MLATINVLKKGLPIANFDTNVTNGNVPLTVQLIDLSIYATGWGWDIGDGAISTEPIQHIPILLQETTPLTRL